MYSMVMVEPGPGSLELLERRIKEGEKGLVT